MTQCAWKEDQDYLGGVSGAEKSRVKRGLPAFLAEARR